MNKSAKRTVVTRRVKKNRDGTSGMKVLPPPPPPPFLCLSRGFIYSPESIKLEVTVIVPLQQLQNRAGVHDAVLRNILHRLHTPSASVNSGAVTTTTTENTNTNSNNNNNNKSLNHRHVVHIESITIHTDSARQANPSGDIQLRATVQAVLAKVQHGLLVGVAISSTYNDTMVVRLRSGPPTPTLSEVNNNNNNNKEEETHNEEKEEKELLVTARCLESEPVVGGQAVLLVAEPGTLRCLALRPPRPAPGPFQLRVSEGGLAEVWAEWAGRGKNRDGRQGTRTEGEAPSEWGQPPQDEKEKDNLTTTTTTGGGTLEKEITIVD